MVYHAADGPLDDLVAGGQPIDGAEVAANVSQLVHRALGDPGDRPAEVPCGVASPPRPE